MTFPPKQTQSSSLNCSLIFFPPKPVLLWYITICSYIVLNATSFTVAHNFATYYWLCYKSAIFPQCANRAQNCPSIEKAKCSMSPHSAAFLQQTPTG